MNTINLTIELGPVTQAKLDKILETLQAARPNCHSCVEAATAYTATVVTAKNGTVEPTTGHEDATPETTHPVEDAAPWGDPEPVEQAKETQPEPGDEATQYTLDDVRALVQKLAAPTSPAHKRTGAKNIVKSYAAKVSDIPADKFQEVMDKLTALAKEG